MLELDDVRVQYGSHAVLAGLSWTLGADAEEPDTGGSRRDAPGITALLGPSGCGKSTLIRAVAGLEPLAQGVIRFDGQPVSALPAHRRDFGVVFQDGQLFTGRTVAANIAYGLRVRGWSRAAIRERVAQMLALVQLAGIADRRVDDLSGGQAQRVALARALAPKPRLLLLDEPLAALDSELREQLSVQIRQMVRDARTPTLMVTHDRQEAARVADTIAVMNAGRIEQHAPPQQLWRRPATEWAARFLGCEVIDARLYGGVVDTELGAIAASGIGDDLGWGPLRLGLRPESLQAHPIEARPGAVVGRVLSCVSLPGQVRTRVIVDSGRTWEAIATTMLPVDSSVALTVDPAQVAVVGDGTREASIG